jgi:hypothetical protein
MDRAIAIKMKSLQEQVGFLSRPRHYFVMIGGASALQTHFPAHPMRSGEQAGFLASRSKIA